MVLQVVTARQYDPTFIIPLFPNFHINPLHKFTKCVFSLKNKTDKPAIELIADIFSPKDLTCKDVGSGTPL